MLRVPANPLSLPYLKHGGCSRYSSCPKGESPLIAVLKVNYFPPTALLRVGVGLQQSFLGELLTEKFQRMPAGVPALKSRLRGIVIA